MVTRAAQKVWQDVLVVGSGPVGATFARKLVHDGRSVCVMDAGAYLTERPGAHMRNSAFYQRNIDSFSPVIEGHLLLASVPTKDAVTITLDPEAFRLDTNDYKRFLLSNQNPEQDPHVNLDGAAVAYSVGGMATHWTCATPRQHPEVERSNILSDEEWDKLYTEAEKILLTNRDSFQHSIRNTLVKETLQTEYRELTDVTSPQNLPLAGYRLKENPDFMHWTGTDDVFGPLIDDKALQTRFSIKPQHLVEKLVFRADQSAVEYAVVRDLQADRLIHVHANQFVVAAGAVLTPQILFNSGHRPRALGRYLCEQPKAFTQVILNRSLIQDCENDTRFAAQIAAHQEKYPEDPLPFPFSDPDPQLYIPVSEGRPWHCQVHRDSFAYGAVRSNVDRRTVVDFRWFGIMEPREDNYVTFSETIKDSMGMPQPTFNCDLSEKDREQNHRMMQDLLRAATAVGGFLPESAPTFLPLGSSLHITGTIRMGNENDGKSVVDDYSKVWGVDNLYLGGNGVIPTGTACNPTLTSVALALRAADKMSQDVPAA